MRLRGKKRLRGKRGWGKEGIRHYTRLEYQIVTELSYKYEVKKLCLVMKVSRSGFYRWQDRVNRPSEKVLQRARDVGLFIDYHERHQTHGYRWLNRKIRLDLDIVMSDQYAHKCCKRAGIKSKARHNRYKRPGIEGKTYQNLILSNLNINRPSKSS